MENGAIIEFQIPYFGCYLWGKGEVLSTAENTVHVRVTNGYCQGHKTDIARQYVIEK